MMEHRNSQKRFIESGYMYFITSKTHGNFPYFREEIFCKLWIEELKLCRELKRFELYGFCLLYDHFHMVLKPCDEFDISKVMKFFKENFSRDANKILGINPIEGETAPVRLQLVTQIKVWNEKIISKYSLAKQLMFPKFQWQHSFRDHVIRNQHDYEKHMDYILLNHIKHKLPKDWEYTSLNFEIITDN